MNVFGFVYVSVLVRESFEWRRVGPFLLVLIRVFFKRGIHAGREGMQCKWSGLGVGACIHDEESESFGACIAPPHFDEFQMIHQTCRVVSANDMSGVVGACTRDMGTRFQEVFRGERACIHGSMFVSVSGFTVIKLFVYAF